MFLSSCEADIAHICIIYGLSSVPASPEEFKSRALSLSYVGNPRDNRSFFELIINVGVLISQLLLLLF